MAPGKCEEFQTDRKKLKGLNKSSQEYNELLNELKQKVKSSGCGIMLQHKIFLITFRSVTELLTKSAAPVPARPGTSVHTWNNCTRLMISPNSSHSSAVEVRKPSSVVTIPRHRSHLRYKCPLSLMIPPPTPLGCRTRVSQLLAPAEL